MFSSVERGGEGYDEHLLQDRAAKAAIERHIKSLEGLRWTFVRPAFFMENFDGAIGSITTTVLKVGLKKDTKLQLIVRSLWIVSSELATLMCSHSHQAAEDIGHVGFAVFQVCRDWLDSSSV